MSAAWKAERLAHTLYASTRSQRLKRRSSGHAVEEKRAGDGDREACANDGIDGADGAPDVSPSTASTDRAADPRLVYLTHKLESSPDLGYNDGLAWFCLNNVRHEHERQGKSGYIDYSRDEGLYCRRAYQDLWGDERHRRFFEVMMSGEDFDSLRLLDLGNETERLSLQNAANACPALTEPERKRLTRCMELNSHDPRIFESYKDYAFVIADSAQTRRALSGESSVTRPSCAAFEVHTRNMEHAFLDTATARSFFATKMPRLFLRDFHNEDAVTLGVILRKLGMDGWKYSNDAVYRFRAEPRSKVIVFEKEPGEVFCDLTLPAFSEFRKWLTTNSLIASGSKNSC